ncbi:MAG: NAD-dependent malic enzyme [Clostridium sp.]|uniref:NAD-dependent malic enzyme n=1 Tax=Clostridium sp. TaxID=1506 RepID=UPI003F369FEB
MKELKGQDILRNPFFNKGTGFTEDERKNLGLIGLLPSEVRTIEEQEILVYEKVTTIENNLDKHLYLMDLYNRNRTLFYYTISGHVKELLPIIYTPTIGDAVINYSNTFNSPSDAVFLSVDHKELIEEALKNAAKDLDEIKLIVVTDGEGVLGIGDWGVNGVSISIGKLAVYTVAAGVNPRNVLPVVIDAGTNNEKLLNNPFYLGEKHLRIRGDKYDEFIDEFVKTSIKLFPEVLLHWEDFGRSNASRILEKYREQVCTFNDDIQGTGVMMVSAMNSICKITNKPIKDHKILVFGGGTAGIGICDQILFEMVNDGLSHEEALNNFYVFDRFGLITTDLSDLTEGQKKYAKNRSDFGDNPSLDSLENVIELIKPTVLIGTSGVFGAFTEEAVNLMAKYNERPAIMPISNPTSHSEATADDLINWTSGKALVVTGSPSAPVIYDGVTYNIGQANNALLYPGLGLGLITSKPTTVTDSILSKAAHAIIEIQDLSAVGASILPPVSMLKETSKLVAEAVVSETIVEGLNRVTITDAKEAVKKEIFEAYY